jgi:tripartite-type tricarboxylate transporter receptor subunit TctC
MFAAASIFALPAVAQPYPSKPVRIIVPTSPGGLLDLVSRLLGQKLSELTAQTVIVENRAGASTNIGTEFVARAPGDGYTLLGATLPLVVNPSLFEKLPSMSKRSGAGIVAGLRPMCSSFTHRCRRSRSIEFIAIESKTGNLIIRRAATAPIYIAAELFSTQTGVRFVHVPYKGGGPALASLIAGETDLSFPALGAVLPHVNSGRLRALAITSSRRTPLLPNLVTIAESGFPDYSFTSWVGMLVPATTQPAIIATLNGYIVKAMRSPGVTDRLAADGTAVVASSPEEFSALIKTELARWAKVVGSGMKSE